MKCPVDKIRLKMSISAYVFIKANAGKVADVLVKVKDVPNIKEAHMVIGVYDVVAFLTV
ncbi:MAG: hypothetical protein QMD71_03615 [bacterium]|nr:hypothetical protein [bacterium]